MVITEAKEDKGRVKSKIDIRINEKPEAKIEFSEPLIFTVIIICGLIGLLFLFFSG